MEESKKKKNSSFDTIIWMFITAIIVFVVTSFQYTRLNLEKGVVSPEYTAENVGGVLGFLGLGNEEYITNTASSSGDIFRKLEKVYSVVEKNYLYEYDIEKLQEGAINGMLSALEDPYTSYFNKSDTENFLTETEGEYEGIGVYISFDTSKDMAIVLSPIKNSPADEAGVQPGDYIIEIDGKSMVGVSIEEVASVIKGKKNSEVKIKFLRYTSETEYEEIEKVIRRASVDLSAFSYEIVEDNIGYISFESFDEKVYDQFKKAYKEMKKKTSLKGLIIDLRDNPGGLLDTASDIIDELLPTGVITYTVDKNNNKEYIYSDSNAVNIPIVVIVNENSASAAEIMAAAVKDSDNGAVVGNTTFGKGLVQQFKSLGDGTYIKITICEYFSPKGNKINEIGVEPNYIVENDKETEEDEQLNKAIEVMKDMIK